MTNHDSFDSAEHTINDGKLVQTGCEYDLDFQEELDDRQASTLNDRFVARCDPEYDEQALKKKDQEDDPRAQTFLERQFSNIEELPQNGSSCRDFVMVSACCHYARHEKSGEGNTSDNDGEHLGQLKSEYSYCDNALLKTAGLTRRSILEEKIPEIHFCANDYCKEQAHNSIPGDCQCQERSVSKVLRQPTHSDRIQRLVTSPFTPELDDGCRMQKSLYT